MSLRDEVAGEYRAALEALRDKLAVEIESGVERGTVAPLVKELREVLSELERVAVPEVSKVDQLRERRERRTAVRDGSGSS